MEVIGCRIDKYADEIVELYEEKYGEGNIKLGYAYNGWYISQREALALGIESYVDFFKRNSHITHWLINEASSIVSQHPDDEINIEMVIRALEKFNIKLVGKRAIDISFSSDEKYCLHMACIPFIQSKKILDSVINTGSIEDFYISNSVAAIKMMAA